MDTSRESEPSKTHFEEAAIFNKLITKDEKILFICGKMLSHSIIAKYSFPACDFHLFLPSENKLYHSQMDSEQCFTDSLKWTYNFFTRITACLNTPTPSSIKKSSYIIIKTQNESEDDIENLTTKYFELHFLIKGDSKNYEDITSFRLKLDEIVAADPYDFIMSKALEMDQNSQRIVEEKQSDFLNKEKVISHTKKEIDNINSAFQKRKVDYIIKFNMLEKAKEVKQNKLNNEIRNKNT